MNSAIRPERGEGDLIGACRREQQRNQNPRHLGECRGPLHAGRSPV